MMIRTCMIIISVKWSTLRQLESQILSRLKKKKFLTFIPLIQMILWLMVNLILDRTSWFKVNCDTSKICEEICDRKNTHTQTIGDHREMKDESWMKRQKYIASLTDDLTVRQFDVSFFTFIFFQLSRVESSENASTFINDDGRFKIDGTLVSMEGRCY